jgi:molybdopterin molybdotransferase
MNKARRLMDDCFLHDKDRLKHADALKLIAERVNVAVEVRSTALAEAHGRVIAETVAAPRDVPDFANAAVDGYAFAHASLGPGETKLKVGLRIAAGAPASTVLGPKEAARIFTGAPMPGGSDTCVMQEDVMIEGEIITVPPGLKYGVNCRHAGEDLKRGEIVVRRGDRLRPQEIAAIASTGRAEIDCFERLRVGLLSTGNELVRPGAELRHGQVYDSNHSMLRGLIAASGAEAIDFGIAPDNPISVERLVAQAAEQCHVIVTTGGASRGDADHIVSTIMKMGVLHAWQLAVKPGRPLAMGQIGDKVFLGLPGNPVAVFVTYLLYVQPVLARLQGMNWREPQRYAVSAGFTVNKKKTGRREFWRGWIETGENGTEAKKFARDGSGLISGLREATGLIEAREEMSEVREGDSIDFIPFTEFGILPR